MRIILDECVHAHVRRAFPGHAVKTVTESGWRSTKDGQLLAFAEKQFDVFITVDQRLERQNSLRNFRLGFVIVRVPSNKISAFLPLFEELRDAAASVRPGQVIYVGEPRKRR